MPFAGTASASGLRRKLSPSAHSPRAGFDEAAGYTIADNTHEQGPRNEDIIPLLDGHHSSSQPYRSSGSSNSVIVSPSVRALAALSGSPLPISPQRVEAKTTRRTSSVPRSRLQSPSNGLGSRKRATYPSGTAKTADLIEAFPEPPRQQVRCRNSAPARMSLFPALIGQENRGPNASESSPVRPEHASSGSNPRQSVIYGINNANSPSASNAWVSGALPNPPECDGSADMDASHNHPICGEDLRYRHSRTLMYDVDTTSLQDLNQAEDVAMSAPLSPPGSPTSGRTGATRFFSAASQLGTALRSAEATTPVLNMTDAQAQFRNENRVQQERAVANGALRFVSQSHSTSAGSGMVRLLREETVVPVALTSHGRACLHKNGHLRVRRSFRLGVDGAQESRGGEDEPSRWNRYCLICRAKSVVHRVSKFAGGKARASQN